MKNFIKPLFLRGIGLGMIGAAVWLTQPSKRVGVTGSLDAKLQADKTRLIREELQPLLLEEERQNQLALGRAQQRLAYEFRRYRAGVPAFLEELTTFRMRFKMTKAIIADWWSETNGARILTTQLFAQHVVSDRQLEDSLRGILTQFENDLEANRNSMLATALFRFKSANFPLPPLLMETHSLHTAFNDELRALLTQRAQQSPVVSMLSIGGSVVAEEATRAIVTQLVRALAIRLAAGGATATSAAAGGTGGTLITPGAGTVVGIAAGLVVGFAVDMWTEARFKEKVGGECADMLSRMESEVWNVPQTGLKTRLLEAIRTAKSSHEATLRKLILGGEQHS